MDENLSTLIEAIIALRERLDGVVDEVNGFQDDYSKEKQSLQSQIDGLLGQIQRLVIEEVSKIPKPSDGKDGKDFNRSVATALIRPLVDRIAQDSIKDISEIKADLKSFVIKEASKWSPKDGKDGVNGKDGIAKDGEDGINADKAISISDIQLKKDKLIIYMSDGSKKEFTLPKVKTEKTIVRGGGSSSRDNFSYDLIDSSITIPYNQQMIIHGEIEIVEQLLIDGKLIIEV